MEKYTTYCTEKQTRKAKELGAPIEYAIIKDVPNTTDINNVLYRIPTTEQMIGWLESQNEISEFHIFQIEGFWHYAIYDKEYNRTSAPINDYNSRKEATLTAINAALDYLKSMK